MGKENHNRLTAMYEDPFQSPRANPKHSFNQVNGETQQSLHNHVLKVETRKRS